jgi:hypothetical protein
MRLAPLLAPALLLLPCVSGAARGQEAGLDPPLPRVYRAPGFYGTAWGNASYGIPRTYSDYASPFGLNYGLGVGPYRILPGAFGQGLWSDSLGIPTAGDWSGGYLGYRTFAHPPVAGQPNPGIGVYAPMLGPPFLTGDSFAR